MIASLVNTQPEGAFDVGWGWYFHYGNPAAGGEVGAVYLFDARAHAMLNRQPAPYAVRFVCADAYDPVKMNGGKWFIGHTPVEKRELTVEEIAWFEAVRREPLRIAS